MLAYVFWHWMRPDASTDGYERAQRAFHEVLAAHPSAGFHRSWSAAMSGAAPWVPEGRAGYEDWYLVDDFTALDALNTAAVSAARQAPHDAAAALADGGTAGIMRLRGGQPLEQPRVAHWFGKPAGMSYAELTGSLAPLLARGGTALWMRQMTLGPAREFVVHAGERVELPSSLEVTTIALRPFTT
jgi:hypothetical protein